MKSTEFLIEDYRITQIFIMREWVNRILRDRNEIYESSDNEQQLGEFLRSITLTALVGHKYYIASIRFMAEKGVKYIDIAESDIPFIVMERHGDEQYLTLENTVTKQQRRFPEVPGPMADKTHVTVLFGIRPDKDHALTMLTLKFGDWQINRHEI